MNINIKSKSYASKVEVNVVSRFQSRWAKELVEGDPYYNLNLTLDREEFSPR